MFGQCMALRLQPFARQFTPQPRAALLAISSIFPGFASQGNNLHAVCSQLPKASGGVTPAGLQIPERGGANPVRV